MIQDCKYYKIKEGVASFMSMSVTRVLTSSKNTKIKFIILKCKILNVLLNYYPTAPKIHNGQYTIWNHRFGISICERHTRNTENAMKIFRNAIWTIQINNISQYKHISVILITFSLRQMLGILSARRMPYMAYILFCCAIVFLSTL